MNTQNPFPGPVPYRELDRKRFFGRKELERSLRSRIFVDRCTVIFGPSGCGKSSLLQAKVIPKLVEEHDFRVVRVDTWPRGEAPLAWWLRAIFDDLKLGPAPVGDIAAPANAPNWHGLSVDPALAARADAEARLDAAIRLAEQRSERPILMFLDQLEQLLYPDRSAAETDQIFAALEHASRNLGRGVQLILSLREDYLGRFRGRAQGYRELLAHGFRIGPLTVGELTDAMVLAAASGEPAQEGWSPTEVRSLMLEVRAPGEAEDDSAEAQAAFGQIVCRALWEERASPTTQVGHVAAEAILTRYTESILESLGPIRDEAVQLLEQHLIDRTGHRALLTENEARAFLTPATAEKLLDTLETAAILRATAHQGSRYFELGHDWLARRVSQLREKREAEAQAAADRAKREEQRRLEEQARLEELRQARLERERVERERETELRAAQERHEQERLADAKSQKLRRDRAVAWSAAGTTALLAVAAVLTWTYLTRESQNSTLRKIAEASQRFEAIQSDDEAPLERLRLEELIGSLPNELVDANLKNLNQIYAAYWGKVASVYEEKAKLKFVPAIGEQSYVWAAAGAARRGRHELADLWQEDWPKSPLRFVVSTLRIQDPIRIRVLGDKSVAVLTQQGMLATWTPNNEAAPLTIATEAGQVLAAVGNVLGVVGKSGLKLLAPLDADERRSLLKNTPVLDAGSKEATALGLRASSKGFQALVGTDQGRVVNLRIEPREPIAPGGAPLVVAGLREGFPHVTATRQVSGIDAIAFGADAGEFITGSRLLGANVCRFKENRCEPIEPGLRSRSQAMDVRADPTGSLVISGQTNANGEQRSSARLLRANGREWISESSFGLDDALIVASDVIANHEQRALVVSAVRRLGKGSDGFLRIWGPGTKVILDIPFPNCAPTDVAWLDEANFVAALSDGTVRQFTTQAQSLPSGDAADAWAEWQKRLGLTLENHETQKRLKLELKDQELRPLWPSSGPGGFTKIRGPIHRN